MTDFLVGYTSNFFMFQDNSGDNDSTSGRRFDKGSSPTGARSSGGSESPKAPVGGRRRFGSMADDLDVAKFNGGDSSAGNAVSAGSSAEMEAMKQEILREMRKEMNKMKTEIIEGE